MVAGTGLRMTMNMTISIYFSTCVDHVLWISWKRLLAVSNRCFDVILHARIRTDHSSSQLCTAVITRRAVWIQFRFPWCSLNKEEAFREGLTMSRIWLFYVATSSGRCYIVALIALPLDAKINLRMMVIGHSRVGGLRKKRFEISFRGFQLVGEGFMLWMSRNQSLLSLVTICYWCRTFVVIFLPVLANFLMSNITRLMNGSRS